MRFKDPEAKSEREVRREEREFREEFREPREERETRRELDRDRDRDPRDREERRLVEKEKFVSKMHVLEALFSELSEAVKYEPPFARPLSLLFSTVASTLLNLENSVVSYNTHQIRAAVRSALVSVYANYPAQTLAEPGLNQPYRRVNETETLPGTSPADYQGSPQWYRDSKKEEFREEFEENLKPSVNPLKDAERRTERIREDDRDIDRQGRAVARDISESEHKMRREKEEIMDRERREREREDLERKREAAEREREREVAEDRREVREDRKDRREDRGERTFRPAPVPY